VEKTGEGKKDTLFNAGPDRVQVFQWHEDTFDVPEGAVLLAEGKDCKNQAFRVGQNAYGLQFHIEVTEDMIRSWFQSGEEAVVEKILKDTKKVAEKYHTEAKRILLNFMRIAESSLRLRRVIKLFVEEGRETKKRQPALWWDSKERALTTVRDV
jgi:GMP synthase (glutamine-hydrolysing)